MTEFASATEQVIDTYCAAWNEHDPAQRRKLLSEVWADGATYTDPTFHAVGIDELLTHIDAVLTRRPTDAILRTSAIDTHHNLARFAWRAAPTDGTPPTDGLDLVEFTPDGRIQRIIGFFGPLEPTIK
ncbi:nuclear transport factor 2 family protein [Nocardia sp. NPDC052566]|uniref:nuclear transport factor 2 family protein n=1 Tax=Nocardia sp. NPDC052566 TaxID=3364330 RepID=UPI0037C71071